MSQGNYCCQTWQSNRCSRSDPSTKLEFESTPTHPKRKKSRIASLKTALDSNLVSTQRILVEQIARNSEAISIPSPTARMAPATPISDIHHSFPSKAEETSQSSETAASSRKVEAPGDVVYNDIERLLCHEDMPQLLLLAANVKRLYQTLTLVPAPTTINASHMDPREVLAVVDRIKQQHCTNKKPTVERGIFPLTDSILEESLLILQTEVERCERFLHEKQEQEAAFKQLVLPSLKLQVEAPSEQWAGQCTSGEMTTSSSPDAPPSSWGRKSSADDSTNATSSTSIATKYAKRQTDILMEWMMLNKAHPFPSPAQIIQLCEKTELTHSQVVNWTTNVRKRNWKATVSQGKKPHHFVDFLFLAQDRDQRRALQETSAETAAVSTPSRRGRSKSAKAKKAAASPQRYDNVEAPDRAARRVDASVCDALSPCRTPKSKGAAISPTASTIKSPDVQDGVGDTPKSIKIQGKHHEGGQLPPCSVHTGQANVSFVSPCESPFIAYSSGETNQHPQAPPSPYRFHYHAHYHQRPSHLPPSAPFLPRTCGLSSDYYFYNPTESTSLAPVKSSAVPRFHGEMYSRHTHSRSQKHHQQHSQLHTVSESFDNNCNDSVNVGPTDPLDPWGDDENEACTNNGGSNAYGPASLMDAFARYWFEKCQDPDDNEDNDDVDKDAVVTSTVPDIDRTTKRIPTAPRRFGSAESLEIDTPHAFHDRHHHHKVNWQDRHCTATSNLEDPFSQEKRPVETAVAPHTTKPTSIPAQSPGHAAVNDQELKQFENIHMQPKLASKSLTSQHVPVVKRCQSQGLVATINTTNKCLKKSNVKRERSTSFDEEEWTTTTQEGDVADFIRELGLEEAHV